MEVEFYCYKDKVSHAWKNHQANSNVCTYSSDISVSCLFHWQRISVKSSHLHVAKSITVCICQHTAHIDQHTFHLFSQWYGIAYLSEVTELEEDKLLLLFCVCVDTSKQSDLNSWWSEKKWFINPRYTRDQNYIVVYCKKLTTLSTNGW